MRAKVLELYKNIYNGERPENFGPNAGLWLDKHLKDLDKQQNNTSDEASKTNRSELVREVCKIQVPEIYDSYFNKWQNTFKPQSPITQIRRAKVNGRLIIGLGAESLLETSISLDRTYGVPYIPGSALKGVAASYAHQYMNDDWKKPDKKQAAGKYHRIIFGDAAYAGFITFHSGLYIPNSADRDPKSDDLPLYPDIITVHHKDYYQGKAAPTDRDDPNPIPFISTTGSFLLTLSVPAELPQLAPWLDATWEVIGLALEHLGIGAKTSSGYGRMKLSEGEAM